MGSTLTKLLGLATAPRAIGLLAILLAARYLKLSIPSTLGQAVPWLVLAVATTASLFLHHDSKATTARRRHRAAPVGPALSLAIDPVDPSRPLNAPCTGHFLARRGILAGVLLPAVHVRVFLPPTAAGVRGVLFFGHGYAAHCNRNWSFLDWFHRLSRAGFAVFAHDHRGHGYSGGERALVETAEELLDDWEAYVRMVRCAHTSPGAREALAATFGAAVPGTTMP